jgi:lipid-binding SYLF domain-containing protein
MWKLIFLPPIFDDEEDIMYRTTLMQWTFGAVLACGLSSAAVYADTAEDLSREARTALNQLYTSKPIAKDFGDRAKAVIVFPNIVKAGLVFGGAYGEGVMIQQGRNDTYYNSFTGSWGLQAGAQSYGYALFLMTDEAINWLNESKGLEVGVGPTVVVMDEGAAANVSTSTIQDDVYAFAFNQQGLMAGISIEGTKITVIDR